nr:uncharacterized protein LOC129059450 isoform X2 [Pongo abelii]XP_054411700.1 uncharacterized protein LOC129059450 isoform X2 [Pongo abelii]
MEYPASRALSKRTRKESPGNISMVGLSGGVSCALGAGVFRRQSSWLQRAGTCRAPGLPQSDPARQARPHRLDALSCPLPRAALHLGAGTYGGGGDTMRVSGAFGRNWAMRRAFMNGISSLIRRDTKEVIFLCLLLREDKVICSFLLLLMIFLS